MNVAADFQLAVAGLLGAAIQIGIGVCVLGLALVLIYAAIRDSL